jgi:hypothetical protein
MPGAKAKLRRDGKRYPARGSHLEITKGVLREELSAAQLPSREEHPT